MLTNDEYIFEMLLGFVLVFAGNTLLQLLEKEKKISAFLRFIFSTAFAYIFTCIRTLTEFFTDYYSKNTCLQKYSCLPPENLWIFKLFGKGINNPDQYPVFDTDLVFFSFVIGCALGGGVLWLYYVGTQKEKPFRFHRTRFADYVKNEIAELKRGVHPVEYISWWVLRIAMIAVAVWGSVSGKRQGVVLTMIWVNTLMTFIIPLIRFVFFAKLFFGKLPYRVQTFINVFVFLGSFLGHGLDVLYKIPEYDKIEHFISGGLTVLIGYVILEGFSETIGFKRISKVIASLGLSGVVMIVWEIFEFISDFFIEGANNQNWYFTPDADMLFIKIFGFGAAKTAQYPLLDTNIDLIFAIAGVAVCLPLLILWIRVDDENRAKNKRQPVTVSYAVTHM